MNRGTLRERLTTLRPPLTATFSVTEVRSSPRAFAALDGAGRPALLVETSSGTSRDVVRRGLRLQHRATCHVEIGGEVQTLVVSLVACQADDPSLHEAFVSIGEVVLSRLSGASEWEIARILEELVELLERPGEQSREGAIGLFAELLIISLSRDPVTAARAWRREASDRYDFSVGDCRLEVKASGTRERRHNFSLEQCVPDSRTQVFVASTLVLDGSGGTSVRDLAERVQEMVMSDVDLVLKVERALIHTMGLPRPGEPIFDEAHAVSKLQWYNMSSIPAIRRAPAHVDQVRFRVDFESVVAVPIPVVESQVPDLAPCLPG